MNKSIMAIAIVIASLIVQPIQSADGGTSKMDIIPYIMNLNKSTEWQLVQTVKLNFKTYHTQGMIKIDDYFYMSSAEIIEPKTSFKEITNGYDRTPGKGRGHLFKFDSNGNFIAETTLGDGDIYHPGGIDYDGKYIWVPVAEYRPNSRSIIYRVNPSDMKAEKMFYFGDHIGALTPNPASGKLYGASWGSRRFYEWNMNQWPGFTAQNTTSLFSVPEFKMKLNPEHFVDYQDTHYIPPHYMLCSGLNGYDIKDAGNIALGGLTLFDLDNLNIMISVPVALNVTKTKSMLNNPFWFELVDGHLRFYFIPEDDNSNMYIYDVTNK